MKHQGLRQIYAMVFTVILFCCFTLSAHAWRLDATPEEYDEGLGLDAPRANDLRLLNWILRMKEPFSKDDNSELDQVRDATQLSSLLPSPRFEKRQRPCFWNVVSCY
ncbi:uncharacterized protein LOC131942941 [Physella acuta]|uniref:uncharacterized protein LOC131942941 n=1 Tax=Physella acuta TaxID=109671 RepID=UPI0027DD10A8|nr:uncharacterized protein LOC131942941 [Physella acuta]